MKKTLTMAVVMAAALTACTGSNNESNVAANEPTAQNEGCKIAYVEVDTLMNQYQFCKDYSIILTRKGENIQKTLADKERALQTQASQLQRKYEAGMFTSEAELKGAQQNLQRAQNELQTLGEQLSGDFAEEQAKFNNAMRDSVKNFLSSYNKTKKYDYILSRAGDNILLANPACDITAQVVEGLNKRYKPSAETTEQLKNAT